MLNANYRGVVVSAYSQPSGSCDLGTASAPGGNTIQGNTRGLCVDGNAATTYWVIQAAGNTWDPSVQGADADGHMAAGSILSGPYTAAGTNFYVGSELVAVHF